MRDLRQTRNYVNYLKLIGWKVGSVNNVYYFSKEIPVIGSVIKIQRPENIISVFSINEIVKQKRAFMVIIEPLNQLQFDYYSKEWGFKAVKSPSLPSKTIHIDLTKNEKQLLSQMHNKARYNIGLSKRRGVIVKKSNDIKLFSDFWTECAKKRNLFLSLKSEINAIHKAFGKNAQILFAFIKNDLLAGVLLIYTDEITYYMYAASTPNGYRLFAPSLLVWESLRHAKKKGSKIFDFEGIYDERYPLKSWRGFTRFKKGFGGCEIEFPGSLVKYYLPV